MYHRLIDLIGIENFNIIKNKDILLIGLGGVGGYVLEGLVRNGFNNITIIDNDVIDETNLNRQVLTNTNNIGLLKTEVAEKRAKSINESINIKVINRFIEPNEIKKLNIDKYDYIIDAIDYVPTKIELMKYCYQHNNILISSMGTAKKIDASKLIITTLDKTSYDPLAKVIRKELNKDIQKHIKVVSSTEQIFNKNTLGTCSHVPAVAGLLIVNYIFNNIIKNDL